MLRVDPLKPVQGGKKTEKGVKPEVRGVSVSPDSEEAEVLESDPGDGSVPKVANSAVQSRQVARNHSHVSRVAGEGIRPIQKLFGHILLVLQKRSFRNRITLVRCNCGYKIRQKSKSVRTDPVETSKSREPIFSDCLPKP